LQDGGRKGRVSIGGVFHPVQQGRGFVIFDEGDLGLTKSKK
jgi:hypothetical protein